MKHTSIRNSTAEFLIFTAQVGEQSIEARYEDETLWLSQKLMAELFGIDVRTVSEHLKNIFVSNELVPEATVRKFRIVTRRSLTSTPPASITTRTHPRPRHSSPRYRTNCIELAEDRAIRQIPMSMEDWSRRLDAFLEFDDREILQNSGTISAKIAQAHAESEFETYRVIQDRLLESDFDKVVKKLETGESSAEK